MSTNRQIKQYWENNKRDRQYDEALRQHLRATQGQPGRTYNQIANALGLVGKTDRQAHERYVFAIRDALHSFALNDDETICWCPNLRLPEAVLEKKRAKNRHDDYGLKLYKRAPWRKEIDRDPSRTDEVVSTMIREFVDAKGPQSGNAVRKKLQLAFGHLSKEIIAGCLDKMETDGVLVRRDGKAHAKPYHLAV